MAEVVWTIPALNDLEGILEYIELDDVLAARRLAKKVFAKAEQLGRFPDSGLKPKELAGTPYRRNVVGPVLIYHRKEVEFVYIVHVRRGERNFRSEDIHGHDISQQVD